MLHNVYRSTTKVLAVMLAAVLLAVATPLSIASAQNNRGAPTIADIAVATPELSTLVTALTVATDAGPVDFLGTVSDPNADLTVFAPTNDAFAALGDTLDAALADPSGLLTNVLLKHVVDGSRYSGEFYGIDVLTTLLGEDVKVSNEFGRLFINDAEIVVRDIWATNGLVHVIDAVLLPNPPAPEPTIADIAVATPELSTLVTALTVATDAGPVDFLGTVSDPNADLTVFAPTNDAFAALGDTLDAALADPSGLLTNVLLYHVLGTSEAGADLAAAGTATTLLGEDLTITVDVYGDVFINDAKVVIQDIQASNGIVHVIDAVLLPATPPPALTIADIAVATPELSTLVTALTVATDAGPVDFLGTVSDPNADLTVFAPTNDAFAALGDTLDAALADPSGLLTNVLLKHVVGESLAADELINTGAATTLFGEDVAITVDADGNVFINNAKVVIQDIQADNGIVHVIDAVLLPDPPPAPQTIADIAVATPELSTLVTALTVATDAGPVDFLGTVSDPNADLTVFAPTNDAFAALGDTLDAALADPSGLLTNVLLYHVLGTSEAGADLAAAGTATTLLGEDVAITVDVYGQVFINDALVVIQDIQASNGIVHVIDAVLLPPAPEEPVLVDGARVNIISAVSGRYLDGDRSWWGTNVDTSRAPRLDDEWILRQTSDGNWKLQNAAYWLYLDADNARRHYNVDLAYRYARGTTWEITELDNGNFLLRTTDFDRFLDYDRRNVDTSAVAQADDEWQIVIAAGH